MMAKLMARSQRLRVLMFSFEDEAIVHRMAYSAIGGSAYGLWFGSHYIYEKRRNDRCNNLLEDTGFVMTSVFCGALFAGASMMFYPIPLICMTTALGVRTFTKPMNY